MSEDQKYQGALYKEKKAKPAQQNKMNRRSYVEEVPDEVPEHYRDYEDNSDARSPVEPLPEAPTPPAAPEGVNVFDFLVASNTPNASTVNFPNPAGGVSHDESTQLVRYDYEANGYDDGCMAGDELAQYGTGPIPTGPFETPAPKSQRKKSREGSEVKSDKKRKRLHIETDQVMVDAPPVLHSGLTGGLNKLMKPVLPPSPDYSGGDGPPTSPIKKSKQPKHSKSSRTETSSVGSNLLAMVTPAAKTKVKRTKKTSKKTKSRPADKAPKLIEYKTQAQGQKAAGGEASQMVVYKPRSDLFLSFVNKGPESERGCSVNKALKRYHRERADAEDGMSKVMEEKELWKSLRLRRNDRGEIVLFGLE